MVARAGQPNVQVRPESAFTVEFAGIPGAGKTTLSRYVGARLEDAGLPVERPLAGTGPSQPAHLRLGRKAFMLGQAAAAGPLLTARIAGALARSGQPSPIDLAARFVQLQVTQQALRRAASMPVLSLFDEGLVQGLWSTGLRGRVGPVLEIVRSTPGWLIPDMVVIVNTPPQVALSRLGGRQSRHSRTQALAPDAQLAELVRGSGLLEELVGWSRSELRAGCEVVEVSGLVPPTDSAGPIVRRVLSRHGPERKPARG